MKRDTWQVKGNKRANSRSQAPWCHVSFAGRAESSRPRTVSHCFPAFTLVELLMVIAVIAILAALLMPSLNAAKMRAQAAGCMSNCKQLVLAWQQYAMENNDRLAINSDQSLPYQGTPSWISGVLDWTTNPVNTNTSNLIDDSYSLLGNLLGHNTKVFACPAANYVSPAQQAAGWTGRCRSVAMDGGLGAGNRAASLVDQWPTFFQATKMSDLRNPGPSDTWVFADEHPDFLDDGIFYLNPSATGSGTEWFTELPGSQHGLATGISFADGRAMVRRWLDPETCPGIDYQWRGGNDESYVDDDPDLPWLSRRCPLSPN
ncbi:MAG: type II secretion system protein [Verrucomicrobiota bacterium]